MILSAAIRAKARASLRGHWQTALLIALIVSLPSLLVQGIAVFTKNDLMTRLEDLILRAAESPAAMNALPGAVRAMISETGVLAMSGLSVLAWLITPVLSLGLNHWALERIRGSELPLATVFSRVRIFLKCIGLRLLILLKVLLWTLPGLAVFLLAVIPLLRADVTSAQSVLSAANFSILLTYGGMIATLVLGFMGYLYYALADFILADEPEERILSCARRSRAMMKGFRGALFSLLVSFLLWYFLITIVSSMVAGIAGSVMGLMVEMLGSLFLNVYILTSEGVFYEALRLAPAAAAQGSPEARKEIGEDPGPDDRDGPDLD